MQERQLRIITKVIGAVSTNCYFLMNMITKEAIIIDPADHSNVIENVILTHGLKPKAILLTHGHFDHILAANQIKEKYQIPIIACEQEKFLLENSELNLSTAFGGSTTLQADQYVADGSVLEIAGFSIKVIHTPGHTEGSACYYIETEDVLISGDTLFCESVGRTDFPTGSTSQIIRSIKEKLFILPDSTVVYPGHGDISSIGHEKEYNSFCQ